MGFFMGRNKTRIRKKITVMSTCVFVALFVLIIRMCYVMIFQSDYYTKRAIELQQRERPIKAARGKILDRNGVVLADNESVCTISVIHNQITDAEKVIKILTQELDLSEEKVRKRVEKVSSIEKMKSNVEKEVGDRILSYNLDGVKVDEDYKRVYPFGSLASKVLGFTGGDNQGIIGLEAKYDSFMTGIDGKIQTVTDARGIEVTKLPKERQESVAGNDLCISLDYNIQSYCMQAAKKVYLQKEADSVSILAINPQNGEILSMVDYPEYDLNDPFELSEESENNGSEDKKQELLNQMWRNQCVCDTYEPGSIFKIITTSAALEEKLVELNENFYCPGYITVEDRRIHCHKTTGHGSESFVEGLQNSCNPVFIDVGLRIGAKRFYQYFDKFGLLKKTGIDLPGEAGTIMHKVEDIGPVELATISFGQSFQVTPIQMATTVSSLINGGNRITPHFGIEVKDTKGNVIQKFQYEKEEQICSRETSETLRSLLESVVTEGGGNKAYIEGFEIGGKTATSQTLPRSEHKYIASFLGFASVTNPQILLMVIIRNPQGVYYGGTIAAPVAKEIFENILPYLAE